MKKNQHLIFSLSKNKTLPPLSNNTSLATFLLPPQIQLILCFKDVETIVGGVMMVLDHPDDLCGQFSPMT
jgi:hypothetical protein